LGRRLAKDTAVIRGCPKALRFRLVDMIGIMRQERISEAH
jgi:hypothetical protein